MDQSHLTVKELPDTQRPYEKCMYYGPESLTDAELLAVFIRTGTKKKTSIELAHDFLDGGNFNLMNLYDYSIQTMMKLPGIGRVKAIQLKCIAEISRRIANTSRSRKISFQSARAVAGYYMEALRHEKKEKFVVCMLDGKCQYLGERILTIGNVNASLVPTREIFIQALQAQAVSIIILHNHPSGIPQPSDADVYVTECVAACGKMLQVELSDHIIIGDHSYYSFREKGRL
ncbi:MAG: DNA repair protein RadC [Eubacterium sp.]|nr:DNA repair protein RadC [Eubacterium sp.]